MTIFVGGSIMVAVDSVLSDIKYLRAEMDMHAPNMRGISGSSFEVILISTYKLYTTSVSIRYS